MSSVYLGKLQTTQPLIRRAETFVCRSRTTNEVCTNTHTSGQDWAGGVLAAISKYLLVSLTHAYLFLFALLPNDVVGYKGSKYYLLFALAPPAQSSQFDPNPGEGSPLLSPSFDPILKSQIVADSVETRIWEWGPEPAAAEIYCLLVRFIVPSEDDSEIIKPVQHCRFAFLDIAVWH